MNTLQKISRDIIERSFNLSVWTIERFHRMEHMHAAVDELRDMPSGTVGNDIAQCLDQHELTLVPGYESHDLKHVLLDFKMSPEDEIRMQAFMLGNGNYTLPCFAILTFGSILLPDMWSIFYQDFLDGRRTQPISAMRIEDVKSQSIQQVRETIALNRSEIKTNRYMKTIAKLGVYGTIAAGIFGMLFCLPFLFSASLADLIGAGFPFVGGAILVVGGLNALVKLVTANEKQLELEGAKKLV